MRELAAGGEGDVRRWIPMLVAGEDRETVGRVPERSFHLDRAPDLLHTRSHRIIGDVQEALYVEAKSRAPLTGCGRKAEGEP